MWFDDFFCYFSILCDLTNFFCYFPFCVIWQKKIYENFFLLFFNFVWWFHEFLFYPELTWVFCILGITRAHHFTLKLSQGPNGFFEFLWRKCRDFYQRSLIFYLNDYIMENFWIICIEMMCGFSFNWQTLTRFGNMIFHRDLMYTHWDNIQKKLQKV